MAHSCRNLQYVTATQNLCRLALLLIESYTVSHQHNHTTMTMPTAVCRRAERHDIGLWKIKHRIYANQRLQISLACKRGIVYPLANGKGYLFLRNTHCGLFMIGARCQQQAAHNESK